jgi:sulfonate transport system permease protein
MSASAGMFALPPRRTPSRGLSRLWGLLLPLLVLGGWEWLSRRDATHAYAFTPLAQIGRAFVETVQSGQLQANLMASVQRASLGLFLGSVAGLLLGGLMGSLRLADRLIGPVYHGIRQVPLLGLAPLFGLWFGSGEGAKLLVVALASFYPITLATSEGLRNVDRAHLEVARVLGLGRLQTFRRVLLPAAVPFIVTGLLQALGFTWIATVGSELLFTVGAGLGELMAQGQTGGRMDIVIVGVTSIAAVGLVLNQIITRIGARLLRWRPSSEPA